MATIAIFDSGVGGLSIYRELMHRCSAHNYVFVSDNHAFPYGTKSTKELSDRVSKVVAGLVNEYSPDLLVIACNTASTIMLPTLRSRYEFPIVGVVPAVKPAALLSHSKVIGLLATPATIKRSYTQNLINEFASHCQIIKVGSSELVQIAEDKLRAKAVDKYSLERILNPFTSVKRLDVLILACTHFPLLINEIEIVFKQKNHVINIVDSGPAIAQRVATLLSSNNLNNTLKRAVPVASQALLYNRVEPVYGTQPKAVFTQLIDDTQLIKQLSIDGFNDIQTLFVE